MEFVIQNHSQGVRHRDTKFVVSVTFKNILDDDVRFSIDNIDTSIVQLINKEWWIIARSYTHDAYFTDIGPFDILDDAVVHLRLSGQVRFDG